MTTISNSVTGKVPDLKEVDFMSIFRLISVARNSVKQCISKFLDLNQNSVPSRSVSNKAVSHKVLLYFLQAYEKADFGVFPCNLIFMQDPKIA